MNIISKFRMHIGIIRMTIRIGRLYAKGFLGESI
jgi:hypothetical protein